MKHEITTIKLSKRTVEFLNELKIHPRQSYEEVILKYIQLNAIEKKEVKGKNKKVAKIK